MIKDPAKKANICFDCKKACGGCSWSGLDAKGNPKFEPVPGWTAEKTKVLVGRNKHGERIYADTYHITACPLFEKEAKRKLREVRKGDFL